MKNNPSNKVINTWPLKRFYTWVGLKWAPPHQLDRLAMGRQSYADSLKAILKIILQASFFFKFPFNPSNSAFPTHHSNQNNLQLPEPHYMA